MKRFLLLALTAGLLITTVAKADLGEAETAQQKVFDVWCGKKKNNCKAIFEGDRLRVNDSKGIKSDQVLFTQLKIFDLTSGYHEEYLVVYKKDDGSRQLGKFLISHRPTSKKFLNQLAAFTGKPVGGMGDPATAAAKKAADAQNTQTTLRSLQMLNQQFGQ